MPALQYLSIKGWQGGYSPYQRVPESDEDNEKGSYDEDGLLQGLICTHDLFS